MQNPIAQAQMASCKGALWNENVKESTGRFT
jgi:hypothetical protein